MGVKTAVQGPHQRIVVLSWLALLPSPLWHSRLPLDAPTWNLRSFSCRRSDEAGTPPGGGFALVAVVPGGLLLLLALLHRLRGGCAAAKRLRSEQHPSAAAVQVSAGIGNLCRAAHMQSPPGTRD